MAEASATRPRVVGETLNEIAREDPEILETVMQVMETEKLLESNCAVDVVPRESSVFLQLGGGGGAAKPPPVRRG
jgi:hypothetical protein